MPGPACSTVPCPVNITTGTVGSTSRKSLRIRRPSSSPSFRSSTTASTPRSRTASSASRPVAASSGAKPSSRAHSPMLKRRERSSSTTRSVPFDCARVELSPFAISLLQREVEKHGGAATFLAVDRDGTAVFLHDGLRDAEPQAGARGLRGEERVEQLRERAAWDAHPCVDDAHLLDLDPGRNPALPVALAIFGTPPILGPA